MIGKFISRRAMIPKNGARGASFLIWGVLLTGIVLRFLYLGADPYYDQWIGYITDEGRWIQHARGFALHNAIFNHNLDIHFFLAPLFQLTNYLVFEFAGVGFSASRSFTALCGSAVLVLFWMFLRPQLTPQALLLGLTLLALQTDLLALSRVAVPEMVIIFFELLIYFVLVSDGKPGRRMLLAGFLLLVATGMKATVVFFLPIFSILIIVMPRPPMGAENRSQKWLDLGLFWTGFGLPIVVAALASIAYLFSLQQVLAHWNALNFANLADHFLRLQNFYIYSLMRFPFEDELAPTFNVWALGLWISALAWMASGKKDVGLQARRYLVTSALWFGFYLLLMLSLEYFPTRYKVHILVPMALFTSVGVSLLQRIGVGKIIESFAEAKGLAAVCWASAVSIPTGVFLAPLLATAFAFAAIDIEPIRIKLACVALLAMPVAYLAHRSRRNRRAVGLFLLFPLVEGVAWLVFSTFADVHAFWPVVGYPAYFAWFSLFIATTLAVCAVAQTFVIAPRAMSCGGAITAVVLAYLTISLIRIAPAYVEPHYSIRDASRDIGRLLSGSSAIATVKGEALFNENQLRYHSIWNRVGPADQPNFLILVFRPEQNSDIVRREYHLLKTYQLYVAPEYLRADPTYANKPVTASVYKKNRIHENDDRQTRLPARR